MAEQLTVARPYAQAAFDYARDNDVLEAWSNALTLLGQTTRDADASSLLSSPRLVNEQKVALLTGILADGKLAKAAGKAFERFLANLAAEHRLGALDAIAAQFERLRAGHEQRIDVNVTSAFKLDDKQQTTLLNALKKRLNREISITTQVDESLIGGAILRAGDTVIDGSVRGRLNRLSEALTT
ncbi:F0F1 ATP synthase subunit delta [Vreelandella jeotgali]|uniref:F0F1 ATP synthase subunit delta n=1 Tax=Vreelandella jeotgali TaxID=553386 RepID=UPI000345881B|nr:F0F1 ATP synthase subunit delta [Halomonas jeotgali]